VTEKVPVELRFAVGENVRVTVSDCPTPRELPTTGKLVPPKGAAGLVTVLNCNATPPVFVSVTVELPWPPTATLPKAVEVLDSVSFGGATPVPESETDTDPPVLVIDH
jgi:hypothetical protein